VSSPSAAMSPAARARLEERIRERIRSFDMPALLDLLAHAGYGEDDIEYRSHRTTVHQGHLVHDIQFIHAPRRRVIITVNVGLISVQSLLPSFILQTLDRMDHERMERFLGYFDHMLLQQRFAGLFPEREQALLPGWGETAEHRLRLLRPTSPGTLHWLFAQVFPEAEVSVRRELRRQPIPTTGIRLGASALGDPTAMGGFALVPTGGVEVSLFCEESWDGRGTPWAEEAPRRLERRLLPRLTDTSLLLTVVLILRDQNDHARVQDDSYLSYAPIIGGPESPQRIVLFSGDTARHAPDPHRPPAPSTRKSA
jgi:hypothetical protein